ncbi:PREDICTED: protein TIFY 5A [Tarenaya hassleriana]|uniref:protein TIFY 5A n=1 Tax=Tarenaya hassleriana TaxID=28532 RepID=UPI00053C36C2|nr:PREDICTED: protein TIFY 5A [Tarenaya hassleriana]
MERNCDLELRLLSSSFDSDSISSNVEELNSSEKEELRRMTIFYNGKMCVSDVTLLQFKEIISLASRGLVEERSTSKSHHHGHHHRHHHPLHVASVKKSLQSFLQKRRDRVQASSPYHS